MPFRRSRRAIAEADDSLSPTVISEATAPWRIIHANQAWCELCGYDEVEARGKPFAILHGPSTDTKRAKQFVENLRAERQAEMVRI